MALQKSSLAALRCSGCQQWMLRSFIASLGGQMAVRAQPRFQQQRPFSRTLIRRNEARKDVQDHRAAALEDINDVLSTPVPETTPAKDVVPDTTEYVPWYLQPQHQPSTASPSPIAARQQLPELPPHPPTILQPLLEHISVDLGMDHLSLLDLRSLDPPPALGANLLMIIGSARSDKHLHVSADRLCRWLRSNYKLKPYADGLLGRAELKVKMRRRLKRSRLLSAVGAKATADSEIDEGLRTGWVCVNVGRVEGGDLPQDEKKVQRAEGVVGFGATFEGCNIVVQLLTEEKRGEVDLERLWDGIMQRARRDGGVSEQEASPGVAEEAAQLEREGEPGVEIVEPIDGSSAGQPDSRVPSSP